MWHRKFILTTKGKTYLNYHTKFVIKERKIIIINMLSNKSKRGNQAKKRFVTARKTDWEKECKATRARNWEKNTYKYTHSAYEGKVFVQRKKEAKATNGNNMWLIIIITVDLS